MATLAEVDATRSAIVANDDVTRLPEALAVNGDSFISRAGTSLFLARGAGRKKPRLAIAAAQAEHEDAAAAFDVSRRDIRPAA